jgi:hypothetical protein
MLAQSDFISAEISARNFEEANRPARKQRFTETRFARSQSGSSASETIQRSRIFAKNISLGYDSPKVFIFASIPAEVRHGRAGGGDSEVLTLDATNSALARGNASQYFARLPSG